MQHRLGQRDDLEARSKMTEDHIIRKLIKLEKMEPEDMEDHLDKMAGVTPPARRRVILKRQTTSPTHVMLLMVIYLGGWYSAKMQAEAAKLSSGRDDLTLGMLGAGVLIGGHLHNQYRSTRARQRRLSP